MFKRFRLGRQITATVVAVTLILASTILARASGSDCLHAALGLNDPTLWEPEAKALWNNSKCIDHLDDPVFVALVGLLKVGEKNGLFSDYDSCKNLPSAAVSSDPDKQAQIQKIIDASAGQQNTDYFNCACAAATDALTDQAVNSGLGCLDWIAGFVSKLLPSDCQVGKVFGFSCGQDPRAGVGGGGAPTCEQIFQCGLGQSIPDCEAWASTTLQPGETFCNASFNCPYNVTAKVNGFDVCTCPQGQALQGGKCGPCPGPTSSGPNCVVDGNGRGYTISGATQTAFQPSADGLSCVASSSGSSSHTSCLSGQKGSKADSSCSCVPECAAGSVEPKTGAGCQVCPANTRTTYTTAGSSIGSCPSCAGDERSQPGSLSCTKLKCAAGSHADGHHCCPNGYQAQGDVCCPNGSQAAGHLCCPPGTKPSPWAPICVSQEDTSAGWKTVEQPGTPGLVCDAGASQCCSYGSHAEKNGCVSNDQTANDDGSCCPAGYGGNKNGCCPDGSTLVLDDKKYKETKKKVYVCKPDDEPQTGDPGAAVKTPSKPSLSCNLSGGYVLICPGKTERDPKDPSKCVSLKRDEGNKLQERTVRPSAPKASGQKGDVTQPKSQAPVLELPGAGGGSDLPGMRGTGGRKP